MCGDSTSSECVEKLMCGERACITFTSPPYNVGKTPNGDERKYLDDSDNLDQSDYLDFLTSFTNNALDVSKYLFINIQSLARNKVCLIDYLHRFKHTFSDYIIWDKMSAEPAMAHRVLNSQFEFVYVLSKKAKRVVGTKDFRGTLSNIVQMNSNQDKEFASVHKATFPVCFAEYFIYNFSTKIVYEPFGGTGSTIIACEKTKRKCHMMELDPRYCDIIVERWEEFTGKKAKLMT